MTTTITTRDFAEEYLLAAARAATGQNLQMTREIDPDLVPVIAFSALGDYLASRLQFFHGAEDEIVRKLMELARIEGTQAVIIDRTGISLPGNAGAVFSAFTPDENFCGKSLLVSESGEIKEASITAQRFFDPGNYTKEEQERRALEGFLKIAKEGGALHPGEMFNHWDKKDTDPLRIMELLFEAGADTMMLHSENGSEHNMPQMVWGKTNGLDTIELTYCSCRGTEMSVNFISRDLKVSGQPDSVRRRLAAAFEPEEVESLMEEAIANFLKTPY